MGSLQLDLPSWEVSDNFKMMKVFAISCLVASCWAAPAADAEADPQYLLGAPAVAPVAPVAYHATNCETVVETLITQTCTPTAENVCTTQTVETEEIEYEKVCKEVVDVICDGPAHYIAKREADAEADPQFLAAPYHQVRARCVRACVSRRLRRPLCLWKVNPETSQLTLSTAMQINNKSFPPLYIQ